MAVFIINFFIFTDWIFKKSVYEGKKSPTKIQYISEYKMQWNRMQTGYLSTKKLRNKAYIRSEGVN